MQKVFISAIFRNCKIKVDTKTLVVFSKKTFSVFEREKMILYKKLCNKNALKTISLVVVFVIIEV